MHAEDMNSVRVTHLPQAGPPIRAVGQNSAQLTAEAPPSALRNALHSQFCDADLTLDPEAYAELYARGQGNLLAGYNAMQSLGESDLQPILANMAAARTARLNSQRATMEARGYQGLMPARDLALTTGVTNPPAHWPPPAVEVNEAAWEGSLHAGSLHAPAPPPHTRPHTQPLLTGHLAVQGIDRSAFLHSENSFDMLTNTLDACMSDISTINRNAQRNDTTTRALAEASVAATRQLQLLSAQHRATQERAERVAEQLNAQSIQLNTQSGELRSMHGILTELQAQLVQLAQLTRPESQLDNMHVDAPQGDATDPQQQQGGSADQPQPGGEPDQQQPGGEPDQHAVTAEDPDVPPAIRLAFPETFSWQWSSPHNKWMVGNSQTFELSSYEDHLEKCHGRKTTAGSSGGAAPTTPAQVRLHTPPHFSGEKPDEHPELAIMGFEAYFESTNVPRHDWGKHMQFMLKGEALRAYSLIAVPLHRINSHPTWEQVKDIILSYQKPDAPVTARLKLARIQQTGSVTAFNALFNKLLAQVGPDPPSSTDLLQYYLGGLNKEIRSSTNPLGPQWASVQEAMKYHETKELAELALGAPRAPRYDRHHNNNNKPPLPRLKGVQAHKPRDSSRAWGGKDNRAPGGVKRPASAGSTESNPRKQHNGKGPSNADLARYFGRTINEAKSNPDAPCPFHSSGGKPSSHTRKECSVLRAYVGELVLKGSN